MTHGDCIAVAHSRPGTDRQRYVEAIARGAHEELNGSWEAAGFETRLHFVYGADDMLLELERNGLDLFAFPGKGWRTSNTGTRPDSD